MKKYYRIELYKKDDDRKFTYIRIGFELTYLKAYLYMLLNVFYENHFPISITQIIEKQQSDKQMKFFIIKYIPEGGTLFLEREFAFTIKRACKEVL
jgi:hypothetical protein